MISDNLIAPALLTCWIRSSEPARKRWSHPRRVTGNYQRRVVPCSTNHRPSIMQQPSKLLWHPVRTSTIFWYSRHSRRLLCRIDSPPNAGGPNFSVWSAVAGDWWYIIISCMRRERRQAGAANVIINEWRHGDCGGCAVGTSVDTTKRLKLPLRQRIHPSPPLNYCISPVSETTIS